jgi:probable HAF family extracellular repeat protein
VLIWKAGIMRTLAPRDRADQLWVSRITQTGDLLYSTRYWDDLVRTLVNRNGIESEIDNLTSARHIVLPSDMNARGEVVGSTLSAEPSSMELYHAFLWENGHTADLGALGSWICPAESPARTTCTNSVAYAINADGVIVGASNNNAGLARAVVWRNRVMEELDAFPGQQTAAVRIDASGRIAGWVGYGARRAWLWVNGSVTLLEGRGGVTQIAGMNDNGLIAGTAATAGGDSHAVVWEGGAMTDLGEGVAVAVNARGDVIGYRGGGTGRPPRRAILWRRIR